MRHDDPRNIRMRSREPNLVRPASSGPDDVSDYVLLRQLNRERREKNDREEPARVEQMQTTCASLDVTVQQLDRWRYRLTIGDRVVDYCPRNRRVLSKASERLGIGLRFALTYLLNKKGAPEI